MGSSDHSRRLHADSQGWCRANVLQNLFDPAKVSESATPPDRFQRLLVDCWNRESIRDADRLMDPVNRRIWHRAIGLFYSNFSGYTKGE